MPFNLADGEKVLSQTQWLSGQLTVTTKRLMHSWSEVEFTRFGKPTLRSRIGEGRGRQYLPLEMIDSVRVRAGRDFGILGWSLFPLFGGLALFLLSLPLLFVGGVGVIFLLVGLWPLYVAWQRLSWFWKTRNTTIVLHAGDREIELYSYRLPDDPEVEELLDTIEAARQSLPSENPAPEPVQVTLNP